MVRQKNRYFVVQFNGARENEDVEVKQEFVHSILMQLVQKLHGDFGMAAIRHGYTVKYCNEKTRIVIVRARHGPHKLIGTCIPFIKTLNGTEVSARCLHMGATIRQCYKFIRKHQQEKFDDFCKLLRTEDEKLRLRWEVMNFTQVVSQLENI